MHFLINDNQSVILAVHVALHFSNDTLRTLSVVSTVFGIGVPLFSAIVWLVKCFLKRFVFYVRKPDEVIEHKIRMLEIEVTNLTNELKKQADEQDRQDIKLTEHETKLSLILDNNFRKKD